MLQIHPVAPGNTQAFAALYAIYAQTIEPSEQKTGADVRAAFANPNYRFIVAEEAGVIVGFSILYLPFDAGIWVLEYLAVAPDHEGHGVGGRLFAYSAAMAGEARLGLIEVDADIGEDEGSAKRRRRLGFYARAGCRRLGDISYVLPLRVNGTPPPMSILVHAPASLTSVPTTTVRDWLTRLYVEVYGQPSHDPRIDLMLGRQSEAVWLKPLGQTPGAAS